MAMTIKSVSSAPRTGTPGGALRFGRAALVAGWVVFALATTLSTCIQAIAAPVSARVQNVTEALADTPMGVPNERSDGGSEPPCHHRAGAVSWNTNVVLALTTNYPPSGWVAIEALATPFPVGLTRSPSLAQRATPPPPRRLYLRTLHLLI